MTALSGRIFGFGAWFRRGVPGSPVQEYRRVALLALRPGDEAIRPRTTRHRLVRIGALGRRGAVAQVAPRGSRRGQVAVRARFVQRAPRALGTQEHHVVGVRAWRGRAIALDVTAVSASTGVASTG
ncbi:hypothetical protein [Nocardia alni]|uniref:hypothetical protein n=1 Tax=Nocardia alni TaxID=2815723 RepID=UPI001C2451EA|nr:hypothetical protein [Nocardia alni]